MSIKNKITGYCMWDSDGIGFRFTTLAAAFFGWPNPDQEWSTWSEYKIHGWTTEHFLERLAAFESAGGFRSGDPYPDFVEAFHRLRDLGIMSIVVTDKPTERGVNDNLAWLKDIDCEPDMIVRSRDKTVVLDYATLRHLPVFGVDDNVGHIEALTAAGVDAYVRDMPWNADAVHLPRVQSLHQFADIVEQKVAG